jgi:hypothetical protein
MSRGEGTLPVIGRSESLHGTFVGKGPKGRSFAFPARVIAEFTKSSRQQNDANNAK